MSLMTFPTKGTAITKREKGVFSSASWSGCHVAMSQGLGPADPAHQVMAGEWMSVPQNIW